MSIKKIIIYLFIKVGLNHNENRKTDECNFNNNTFLIISSLLSFYIPTFVIIVIYLKIFLVIRSRASFAQNKIILNLKRISIKKKQLNNANEHVDNNKTTKPVLIETNLDQNNLEENEPKFNSSSRCNNNEITKKKKKNNNKKNEKRDSDVSLAFLPNTEITTNNHNNNNKRESTVTVDGKKMIIKPKKSVASFASKKEKKVTKTLAIVLIVYLVCWLIFFFLLN